MQAGKKAYIITNPMIAANHSAEVTLSKFLRVIKPSYGEITVVGGNLSVEPDLKDVELVSFDIQRARNKIKRALDILEVQFKMRAAIKRMVQKDDPVFFWIGDKMLLPYNTVKQKRAEVNYFIMGNVAKEGQVSRFTQISEKLIRYMAEHATYTCMESKSVIEEWPCLKTNKTRVIHLYTDQIQLNPIDERRNTLGMVCRLTAGKHVLECIKAMAQVHEHYPEWNLEIIGSGRQQQECKNLIMELNAGSYVDLLGWVEHNEIIERAMAWKYLLFPTDTEGMPNGLLEMMGRGIPALATSVGGIKDIVRDGENGFILSENTVEAIKTGIYRMLALDENSYVKYAKKACTTIEMEYSLDGAIRNAQLIIGA